MFEPETFGRDRMDLAEALRALRRVSGLSGERLAARTHMSQAKISRIETGRIAPTILDVERILHALDVSSDEAAELLDLAKLANIEFQGDRETQRRGWAHRHRELAAYEQKSTTLRYALPVMLTGLLQTPENINHTSGNIVGEQSIESREDIATRRLARQQVLTRGDKKFVFLLTEAAVRCRMISASAMAAQIERLISLDMMPNVDIEVIPLGQQVPWVPLNVFVLYDDRLITVETEAGLMMLRDPQDIQYHLDLFEHFRQGALKGEECREFLRGIAEEFRSMAAMSDAEMLAVAVEEARAGLAEGGIPIGAALFGPDGDLWGRGHNRRVQDDDPSMHAETAAFRNAGRRRSYRGTTMVTTLSPCWYCSGLVRQFGISRVIIGEATTFHGGHDWLAEHGVEITIVDDPVCLEMMNDFIAAHPELWFEDIGA